MPGRGNCLQVVQVKYIFCSYRHIFVPMKKLYLKFIYWRYRRLFQRLIFAHISTGAGMNAGAYAATDFYSIVGKPYSDVVND